ncbi:S8 family serine peptidase [soil metagenome]
MKRQNLLQSVFFASLCSMIFYSCEREISPHEERSATQNASSPATLGQDIKASGKFILLATSSSSLPGGIEASVTAAGGTIVRKLDAIGLAIVKSAAPDFITKASAIAGVRSVIHGLKMNWLPPGELNVISEAGPGLTPSDPLYPVQWNMLAIHANEAWGKGYKGHGALVAILDEGFYPAHPDIAANVDLGLSTNFVEGETLDKQDGSFSHGTHVAGIVAAAINDIGTVGVAPEARLMLVKVLSDAGSGSFEDVISGIYWAANHGADVINMSLGGYVPHHELLRLPDGTVLNFAREYQELLVAMNRSTSYAHQKGTVVVAAAGNNGLDLQKIGDYDHYPAGSTNVISVSATSPKGWAKDMGTNLDVPTSYTNYGTSSIAFAAPGGDAYPDEITGTCTVGPLTRNCWVFDLVRSPASPTGYFFAAGTSMASPHVAGVAALIVGKHPDYSPSQVEAILRSSADDLGKPGRDDYFGLGRVNASKAVDQ